MKRYLSLCALVVSAAIFTGCKSGSPQPPSTPPPQTPPVSTGAVKTPAPADAQGILNLAVENSFKAKSVSSEMIWDIETPEMKINLIFDIEKNGGITHTSGEVMGMRLEAYSDGKNTVLLEPMTRRWTRLPPEQNAMMASLEQVQQKIYGEYIQKAVLAGEEKINGKTCQILDASVKSDVFNEILAKQNNPMLEGLEVKFDNAALKIWVEKDAYLIVKAILSMEATATGNLSDRDIEDEEELPDLKNPPAGTENKKPPEPKTTKIKYEIEITNSDYNKVAPIEIPPEAKMILEQSSLIEPANK